MSLCVSGRSVFSAACLLALVSAPPRAADADPAAARVERAAVVLDDDLAATRASVAARLREAGAVVVHALDGLLVIEAPPDVVAAIRPGGGIREVDGGAAAPPRALARSETVRRSIAAWNDRVAARRRAERRRPAPEAPLPEWAGDHALAPPALPDQAVRDAVAAAAAGRARYPDLAAAPSGAAVDAGAPYGATASNTSEFLAGRVSLNLILMQCDGTLDPCTESWTADREAQVLSEVVEGMDWLRGLEPQAGLTFTYHVVAGRTDPRARTWYEPVRRPADPYGTGGEDLWATQILGKMGYPLGDRFARSRALAHQTRVDDGTDWAVNVFVADSLNDADGTFADGRFAYTWISGPHLVMTYDDQNWGIDRMNMVIRHELLHAFYAFDEYGASACTCSENRGYLDGANGNCTVCNASPSGCVMIANGASMCASTRRQVGWADLDGDGVIDVVGEDPDTFLDALPTPICGPVTFSGLAAVVAATNRNPVAYTPRNSISINRIAGVDWRLDGGAWTPALPEDGAFGAPTDRFTGSLTAAPGLHTLEVRARDDHGNVDLSPRAGILDVREGAAPVGSTLTVARGGPATSLAWGTVPGASQYRIYRGTSSAGPWTLVLQTSATSISDTASSTAYYRITSVDACGDESAP